MYCSNCGQELSENAKFCSACGSSIKVAEKSENAEYLAGKSKTLPSKRKKLPIFVILPLIAIVLFGIFTLFQYRGYNAFVNEYFIAMESGNTEKIMTLYSWDYIQERNDTIKKQHSSIPVIQDPTLFTFKSLEDYIYNNDKYYRFLVGKKIESREIRNTSKSFSSPFSPQMDIEVYVVFEGSTQDVIVKMEMERGNSGWYMTGTDAYYASDEAED